MIAKRKTKAEKAIVNKEVRIHLPPTLGEGQPGRYRAEAPSRWPRRRPGATNSYQAKAA